MFTRKVLTRVATTPCPPIFGIVKELFSRQLLAHHNLAALVEPNQVKDCLAEINADHVYFHGTTSSVHRYTPAVVPAKAADHPISNRLLPACRHGSARFCETVRTR